MLRPIFFFDCDNCLYVKRRYACVENILVIVLTTIFLEQKFEYKYFDERKVSSFLFLFFLKNYNELVIVELKIIL